MVKRVLKLIGLSLVCVGVLSVTAIAQNSNANAVEGNYNVTVSSNELGTINFMMILKRDGGKWAAEIKDSPIPLTATSVTVDDTSKITIVADAGGTPVTIVGKFDNGAIAGDWTAGDVKGTWKAAKKNVAVAVAKSAEKPAAARAAGAGAAATPEVVGKQMVGTIDDLTFSSVAVLERFNSLTEAQRKVAADKYLAAYQRATGENLQDPQTALPVVLGLTKLLGKRRFHQNGSFQPEEASKCFARLGQLEEDTIRQWGAALQNVAGKSLKPGDVVFAILTIEPLFDGPTVKTATSQKMLSRLRSIGPGAISRWREALGADNIDDTYAALSLLGAEGLFSGDNFQEDTFAKALPIAQRLILEGRSAKQ